MVTTNKTDRNTSEPLTLQRFVLVQHRPLTKETLYILLQAKVRFGKISYEDVDVLQRKPGWRPSEKQKSDVMEDLKSDAVRIVTFYQTKDGSVTYEYDKPAPSDRQGCCYLIWRCIVACFWGLVHYLRLFCRWCSDKCNGR